MDVTHHQKALIASYKNNVSYLSGQITHRNVLYVKGGLFVPLSRGYPASKTTVCKNLLECFSSGMPTAIEFVTPLYE